MTADQLCVMIVTDTASAEAFIKSCVKFFGGGFHPDTSGNQYIHIGGPEDGKRVFTIAQAERFDLLIDAAFSYTDPYTVALKAMGVE